MARQLRIEFYGACYHIISRGNQNQLIFDDNKDYLKLMSLLKRLVEEKNIILYAYCLMPNHFHLLMETPCGNLSKAMQWLNTSYSVYYNHRHEKKGHLFQGRFKSILVEKESYFLELNRYIHLNPLRAHIVLKPEEYNWSSYKDYIGKRSTRWLTMDYMLSLLSKNAMSQRRLFRNFIMQGMSIQKEIKANLNNNLCAGIILGDELFRNKFSVQITKQEMSKNDISQIKEITKNIEIEKIVEIVCMQLNCHYEEIFKKNKRNNKMRNSTIYLAFKYSGLNNRKLGELFNGLSGAAIGNIITSFQRTMQLCKKTNDEIMLIEKDFSF
ncbi:transposase [Chlamydiota bacterium]